MPFVSRSASSQAGFTLVELLVTIGIIVALAAITVPLVTKFTRSGQTGSMLAETENVQTAMSIMMADQDITTVDELINPVAAANDFEALPTGTDTVPLYGAAGAYLQGDITSYYYCWTVNGEVYPRDPDPEMARNAGPCAPPP